MPGARKHSQFYQKYGVPGGDESSRLSSFKHKRTPRVHNANNTYKMRNNLERMLYVSPSSHGVPMKMRADEEEHRKRSLADRIDVPVSRRISFGGNKRPSVWDRLDSGREELRVTSRSVEVGRKRLRVVSRVSNSRSGSIFRRL